jgi:hypothetical protein
MGKIVAAFGVSHAPGQTGIPELAPPTKKDNVYRAWDSLRARFEDARPDLLVGVSNDHLQNFFHVQPAFCIGTGETHILPMESYAKNVRLTSHPVQGHPSFAHDLIRTGSDNNVDLAFSDELYFRDDFSIPKHFLDPDDRVPLVPILTNCLHRNQPPPRRFLELGRVLAKTAESRPADERIAVIATGGLSHDPTGPNWCLIDQEFDRRFLQHLVQGTTEELVCEYTLEKIFQPGKGGTPEILNWFAALGAVGAGTTATLLCYESVPEWATGMGYVAWNV